MKITMDEVEFSLYSTYLDCGIHHLAALLQMICHDDTALEVTPLEFPTSEEHSELHEPLEITSEQEDTYE